MVKLIKTTLASLSAQGIEATPKNYAKEFYKQSKILNKDIEDIENLESVFESLSEEEIETVKDENISTATELVDVLNQRVKKTDISRFINHLPKLMKPSINQKIYDKIEEIVSELSFNPDKLTEEETISKILNVTNERVDLDRDALKEKADDIRKITNLISNQYEKALIESTDTQGEISGIKTELESLELSEQSQREILSLKSKLVDTAHKLEDSLEEGRKELLEGKEKCSSLEKTIEKLQNDLKELQKEKDVDFLTGILNRRGYSDSIIKMENKFKIFDANYAIIFYDIDNFKDVNDKYGHDCGDVVLKTFASILKNLTRTDDIVCRYGGEEFVALVHYKEKDEIKRYLNRVKDIINSNKFICNEEVKIKLTFSAGVAFREIYNSYDDAMKYADILLYKAKHEGKNQIIFDTGLIL